GNGPRSEQREANKRADAVVSRRELFSVLRGESSRRGRGGAGPPTAGRRSSSHHGRFHGVSCSASPTPGTRATKHARKTTVSAARVLPRPTRTVTCHHAQQ